MAVIVQDISVQLRQERKGIQGPVQFILWLKLYYISLNLWLKCSIPAFSKNLDFGKGKEIIIK